MAASAWCSNKPGRFRLVNVNSLIERTEASRRTRRLSPALTVLEAVLGAALLLALASRCSPFYPLNTYADANCFFTVGKSMVRGTVPYLALYEQKGPLLYLLYGLASLISPRSFFGVYLLEVAAWAAALLALRQIAALRYGPAAEVPVAASLAAAGTPGEAAPRAGAGALSGTRQDMPAPEGGVPGPALLFMALVLASPAFASGGSTVEEYCIPLFLWSLYAFLRLCAAPEDPGRDRLCLWNGALAGAVVLMKFNLCGFYLGWALALLPVLFRRLPLRALARSVGCFLLGAALLCLPFLLYFALHHALDAFFRVYFLNNITQYPPAAGGLGARAALALGNLRTALRDNPCIALPCAAGMVWALFSRRYLPAQKAGILCLLAFLLASVFLGGQYFGYYSLPLAVFLPFALVPVCALSARAAARRRALRYLTPLCCAAAGLALVAALCSNVYFFGASRDRFPQFSFAERMNRGSAAPTLLNYGFMDGGFYTASGIVPTQRYFCTLNILPEEIRAAQDGYLRACQVEYVVTENAPLAAEFLENYRLIARETFHSKSFSTDYYLYQRAEAPDFDM